MFVCLLRRLQRYRFILLSLKFFLSCFNAFRRALFWLTVSYAVWVYIQLSRNFLGATSQV